VLERIREARRNESGFTLIELLIVVVILGVLAGIVVFAVSNFNGEGQTAACKSDVKNVEIASEAYYAKKASWSPDIATLVSTNYLKESPAIADGTGVKYFITYTAGSGTTESTVVGNLHGKTSNDCA
jgi:prepilin-type N-terminal cleavage/methylation domain-containing protein